MKLTWMPSTMPSKMPWMHMANSSRLGEMKVVHTRSAADVLHAAFASHGHPAALPSPFTPFS